MRLLRQLCAVLWLLGFVEIVSPAAEAAKTVYIIPIRDEIATPVTYLVRRGIKQAMEAKADAVILDMETNGGRLDSMEAIIEALNRYTGLKVTYVNGRAFSAGALISFATEKIYMAPGSVIGAAAPILVGPGGANELPGTIKAKMNSALTAQIRTSAEKYGHNIAVLEAMIDESRPLEIEDDVYTEKGQILTLTDLQAKKEYDGKPLLSRGTVASIEELVQELGFSGANVVRVDPTGAEKLASFLTMIGPLLLLLGVIGIYIEMKTPGFGVPGIVGLVAFGLYFTGGYIAGLSGLEWTVIFVLGLALVILEIFVFPGTLFIGLIGGAMMLAALVMAMVDFYPGMPTIPSWDLLSRSLLNVLLTLAGAIVIMMVLSRYLLTTPLYRGMIAAGASGEKADAMVAQEQRSRFGEVGTTVSTLRPGGKAQFGETFLDVVSQGEMIPKGAKVRVVGFSGREPIVEAVST